MTSITMKIYRKMQSGFVISVYLFCHNRSTMRAVDAAINSRQWTKAVQILSVAGDSEGSVRYYVKIAKHFASINEFERAEQFFVGAGATEEAIKMYNDVGKWEEAHRVGSVTCIVQFFSS